MSAGDKHPCSAQLCEREFTLTVTGKIRRHASKFDPAASCPGSGHPPAGVDTAPRLAAEWDKILDQGVKEGRDEADLERARGVYEKELDKLNTVPTVTPPPGMYSQEFRRKADAWLADTLAQRRRDKGTALTLKEIQQARSERWAAVYHAEGLEVPAALRATQGAASSAAPDPERPVNTLDQEAERATAAQAPEPRTPAAAEARESPGRGPWFRASYGGECSECGDGFGEGDDIRADGDGGWQGRECCSFAEDEGAAQATPPSPASFFGDTRPLACAPAAPPWVQPAAPPWITPLSGEIPTVAAPSPKEFFATGPPPRQKAVAQPMTDLGEQITARFKEIFFAYVNRNTSDNRGAQAHMGPSEIGTPCDRRIALSLMRVPSCNPGGDSWASFKGTAIHAALAEMFEWSNHGTGRFVTEVPLEYPSDLVPRGTADLLDRVLFMVDDHKVQSATSNARLRTLGPAPHYRVQGHVYGYGARMKGEEIEHIAIVSWPGDRTSLDNLYTWTEPYDEAVALAAIARVESISAEIRLKAVSKASMAPDVARHLSIGREFPTADDCRFCNFHAPGDKAGERGCKGDGK